MPAPENLIGRKFNKLTVHKRVQVKSMHPLWFCICECGDYAVVSSNTSAKSYQILRMY